MPNKDYISKVYSALSDNLEGFDKTPQEFEVAMQDSAYAKNAFKALKDNLDGFDKNESQFMASIFGESKKKVTASPIQSSGVQSNTSVSPKPSVSQSGGSSYFQSTQNKGIDILRGKSVKPTSEYVNTKKVNGVLPSDKKVELSREAFKQYKKSELIPEVIKDKLGDDRAKALIEKTDWDNVDEATKFNIEKDKRDEVLSTSTARDLIENYSKGSVYSTNPVSFAQSREGKVGALLNKLENGDVIGKNDAEYLSKYAPTAWDEIGKVARVNSVSFDESNPAKSISDFYKSQRKGQLQNYYSNVATNAIKEVGDLGFDISKLGDNEYTAMSMAKAGKMYDDKLAEIEKKYPITIKYGQQGTKDYQIKERSPEYYKEKRKIDELKSQVFSTIGFASAVKYATENPSKSSEEIGEVYMSISNPDRYKNFVAEGKRSQVVKSELSKMGISALLANGNEVSADMAIQDQKDFNEKYPKQKSDELYHRLGAELYKKGGKFESLVTGLPSIYELDNIANTQFSDEDRDFYYKYIRPVESKLVASTNVPLSGFVNKGAEAILAFGESVGKGVQKFTGNRSEGDVMYDRLEGTPIARQSVGEYEVGKQRIKELNAKSKLSYDEIKELNDLKQFVGVRSSADQLIDHVGNVSGQVLAMALGTKGLGSLIGKGVSSAGLLAEEGGVAGATLEDAMASAIDEFGISQSTINAGVADALAYTSSYDDAYGEFMELNPDAPSWKRKLYASGVATLNAVTERMFKDEKILDAFKREVKPSLVNIFNNLSEKELKNLSQKELTSKIKDVIKTQLNNATKFGKAWAKNVNEEAIEEVATSIGTSVLVGTLAPNKFNAKEEFDKAVSTYGDMTVGGLLVSGLGARSDIRNNRIASNVVYQIGVDPTMADNLRSLISSQQTAGKITTAEAIIKNQVINTIEEVVSKNIPVMEEVRPLSQDEKNKLTVLTVRERALQAKVDNEEYKDVKDVLESQLKEIRDERTKLLKKEFVLDDKFNLVTIDEYNANRQQPILVTERNGKFEVSNPNGQVEIFDNRDLADARVVEINNQTTQTNDTQNTQTTSTESATIDGQTIPNVGEESTTENAPPISETQGAVDGNVAQTETIESPNKGTYNGKNVTITEGKDGVVYEYEDGTKFEFSLEEHEDNIKDKEFIFDKIAKQQTATVPPIKIDEQQPTSNKSEIEAKKADIERRRIETEAKIKRKDLFSAGGIFSNELGGSGVNSVPTNHREVNGIEFVEFSNPNTGVVDVIMTGVSGSDFVGYYRLYENGKPTNKWSSKFENQSRNKDNFKTMISGVQEMLPQGHEYTEKTSISTDGLRVWNQQLSKGYELQYDNNGNLITNTVTINGDAIVNELGIDVNQGNFDNISVTSKGQFESVKKALLPYLQKFGLNESNIRNVNGTVEIDLPILKNNKIQQGESRATSNQSEIENKIIVSKTDGGFNLVDNKNIKNEGAGTDEDVRPLSPSKVEGDFQEVYKKWDSNTPFTYIHKTKDGDRYLVAVAGEKNQGGRSGNIFMSIKMTDNITEVDRVILLEKAIKEANDTFGFNQKIESTTQQQQPTQNEEVKPTTSNESEIEAKKDDIEKRRQEEFNQYANDIIVKTELYEDGEGRKYLVHTLKNGKKRLDNANENGERTSTSDVYEGSVPVENYISDAKKIKDVERKPSKQEDRINAKYDAELKALEQPTTPNQSEIEAKKSDIERRRQEELDGVKWVLGFLNKAREETNQINTKYDAELKALEQQSTQNEGTEPTTATSEPIQPKGESKGESKEGDGSPISEGTNGIGQDGATKPTTVLEEGSVGVGGDVESTTKALEEVSKTKPTLWEKIKEAVKSVGKKFGIVSNADHINNFNTAKAEWDKLSSREKKLKRADYELDDLHHTEGGYYKVGNSLIDLDLNSNHLKLLLENNKFLNILNKLGVTKIHGENRPAEEMFAHYSDGKIHLNNNSAFENIRQVTNAMSHELGHHEWTKLTKEERDYVRSLPLETGMAKHYEAQEKNGGKQTSASLQEENFADYVMQYFQGKLYGDEALLNKIPAKLREMFDNKYSDLLKDNEHLDIAEAYHKAKADGTNTELVKAVEQSLKETPTAGSVGVGGDKILPALKVEGLDNSVLNNISQDNRDAITFLQSYPENFVGITDIGGGAEKITGVTNKDGAKIEKQKGFSIQLNFKNDRTKVLHFTTEEAKNKAVDKIYEYVRSREMGNGERDASMGSVTNELDKSEQSLKETPNEGEVNLSPKEKAKQDLIDAYKKLGNSGAMSDPIQDQKDFINLVAKLINYARVNAIDTFEKLLEDAKKLLKGNVNVTDEKLEDAVQRVIDAKGKTLSEANEKQLDNFVDNIENGVQMDKNFPPTLEGYSDLILDKFPPKKAIEFITRLNEKYDAKNPKGTTSSDNKDSRGFTNFQKEQYQLQKILGLDVDEKINPSIINLQTGNSVQGDTSKTTSEVQGRDIDINIVTIGLTELRQVAMQDAISLKELFGDKWQEKTISILEASDTITNPLRVIGILNIISTDLNERMQNENDANESKKLMDLQRRVDVIAQKKSRQAALTLNMRKLLRIYAEGNNISKEVMSTVLTKEQQDLVEAVKVALAQQPTNEDLNKSDGSPKSSKQSKKSSTQQVKEDSAKDLKNKLDALEQNAGLRTDKNGNRVKKSPMDLLKDAFDKLKNIKGCK